MLYNFRYLRRGVPYLSSQNSDKSLWVPSHLGLHSQLVLGYLELHSETLTQKKKNSLDTTKLSKVNNSLHDTFDNNGFERTRPRLVNSKHISYLYTKDSVHGLVLSASLRISLSLHQLLCLTAIKVHHVWKGKVWYGVHGPHINPKHLFLGTHILGGKSLK